MEVTKPNKDFFEEFGLEVSVGDVEIGQTYPIFGMITRLVSDSPGEVVVEINYNIEATMYIPDQARVDMLKQRAFESGIFISRVTNKAPKIVVECQTVIFGRSQSFNA